MIQEVQSLMDEYLSWLRQKMVLREVGQNVEVTTPFLDRHNDHLQFYVQRQNGGYILTDDGYTIEDLKNSGCKLDSKKRQDLLKMTLNGFGVQMNDNALVVHASPDNFNLRKHNLVQAMLAVNDLFYLAEPMVNSLFLEDVTAWLDFHDIRYTPRVPFTGKSGYAHLFDFVIPKSPRRAPERILQTINKPSRDAAERVIVSWFDTKEVRAPDSQIYALLNDSDVKPSASVLDALRNYEVKPILWSARESVYGEIAA